MVPNYKDREWSNGHTMSSNMDILPQDIRQEFDYVIDWFRERVCARNQVLELNSLGQGMDS